MYLGLDLSTQQLKGVIVDAQLRIQSETSVSFDVDLPHYKTKKGVYVQGRRVLSPVAMWIEALDLLLSRMLEANLPLDQIRCISGAGQQHGSVYWSYEAETILSHITSDESLVSQLEPRAFAYGLSPNWQDSSTQLECDEIEKCVGGSSNLARLTGSKAHHRFTGPQIMKLRNEFEESYKKTFRISLVSSFLCSLMIGKIAPIDCADICGGSFWDIEKEEYIQEVLTTISGGHSAELRQKLGKVCMNGGEKLGRVAQYHQQRYGFSSKCEVIPFTGDNPATLLALPLLQTDAMISLGTSTTMLLSTSHYLPLPDYHMFAHPTTKGLFMAMLCYKNGSLARELIRDDINRKCETEQESWTKFNEIALATSSPMDNNHKRRLGFYFPLPEIIPQSKAGTWHFEISSEGTPQLLSPDQWNSPEEDARAILESQSLDIRMRSQPFFEPSIHDCTDIRKQASRIYVVGGASKNDAVVQVLGEVLGGHDGIYRQLIGFSNACAMGAANKAAWAALKEPGQSFEEFVKNQWNEAAWIKKVDRGYRAGVWEVYGSLLHSVRTAEELITQTSN